MPTTLAALNILIFLLPGLVIRRITESLTPTGKITDATRVVDALVYSLINYLLYSLLAIPFHLKPVPLTVSSAGQIEFNERAALSFIILFVLAVIIGLAISKITYEDWHYAILRDKLHLTRATSRVDVWDDIFSDFHDHWLRVHLKDGTQITGWPDYYSLNPEKRELFLANAELTRPDGTSYEVKGSGILLTEKAEIQCIEVLTK